MRKNAKVNLLGMHAAHAQPQDSAKCVNASPQHPVIPLQLNIWQ